MVHQQRWALFNVTIAGITLVLFLIVCPVLGPLRAQGVLGLIGFSGFAPLLFRKRKGEVWGDERDRLIQLRASNIGFGLFWFLFVVGLMSVYAVLRNTTVISVEILPLIVLFGWLAFILCQGVALLVLYRKS
jgi:hypothetical protein